MKKLLSAIGLCLNFGFQVLAQDSSPECNAAFFWDTTMKPVIAIYPPPPPDKHQYFQAAYSGQISYTWDFGDGTPKDSISGSYVKHLYINPGKYLVTLTVNTSKVYKTNPCSDTRSRWITIEAPKNCNAEFEKIISISNGQGTDNTSLVTGFISKQFEDSLNYDFKWSYGDGAFGSGPVAYHHYENEGIYKVALVVQSKNETGNVCIDSSSQFINTRSTGIILPSYSYCDANLISSQTKNELIMRDKNVYMAFRYDGINITRSWDWGDGTVQKGSEFIKHTYKSPGIYIVTLTKSTYYDPCYENKTLCYALPELLCQEKYNTTITVEDKINTEECIVDINPKIDGSNVTFTDMIFVDYFDNSYKETYDWDFGDSTFGSGRNVIHKYAKSGQYIATLTKTIYSDPCPETTNGIRCMAPVSLICSSKKEFKIDIGYIAPTCESSIRYDSEGLKVSFSQGLKKVINNDSVKNLFIYNIQNQKLYWDFGDGITDTTMDDFTVHNYKKVGKYTVKLTRISNLPILKTNGTQTDTSRYPGILPGGCVVISKPCTSYAEIQILVTDKDIKTCKASFDWSIDGNKIKLKSNNSSNNIGFAKLNFGDGDWTETSCSSISSAHTYAKAGTYEICLKIATVPDSVLPYVRLSEYCSDTFCQSIIIGDKAAPTIIAGIDYINITNTSVSVYPNPAQDKVKFYVSKGTDNMTLRIYSSTGELQKEVNGLANQDFELAIPELTNGIYIYSLSNAAGSLSKGKLIVSK